MSKTYREILREDRRFPKSNAGFVDLYEQEAAAEPEVLRKKYGIKKRQLRQILTEHKNLRRKIKIGAPVVAAYFAALGFLGNEINHIYSEKPTAVTAKITANLDFNSLEAKLKKKKEKSADMVNPRLGTKQKEELDKPKGNYRAVQFFISTKTRYRTDEWQFNGSICDEKAKDCEFWAPAALFYLTRTEDCDGPIFYAHYQLRSGVAVLFPDHAVYAHQADNGKYAIISKHDVEQTGAIFDSVDDLARFHSRRWKENYDHYRVGKLPDDDETLLYNLNLYDLIEWGPEISLTPKHNVVKNLKSTTDKIDKNRAKIFSYLGF